MYTIFDSNERVVVCSTRYLRFLQRRNTPKETLKQTGHVINGHCRWLEESPAFIGSNIDEVLSEVDSEDILDWINEQREHGAKRETGLCEVTIYNRETLVKGLYKFGTTDEGGRFRDDIPWGGKNFVRQRHNNLPRFVTPEQVINVLNGMHNENQRVATHFIYDTGIRVSELCRMTNRYLPNENDFPEEANYYPILIPGSKPRNRSGIKWRYSIISRPMLARIRRYHATLEYRLTKWKSSDPDKPTFLNVHGEQLTPDAVRNFIEDACVRQGIDPHIPPHRFRHGAAFSVLRSEFGKELKDRFLVVKSMLGHDDIRTTEIYASIPIAALQSLTKNRENKLRFEEADQIFEATYLPRRRHTERRGHRRGHHR